MEEWLKNEVPARSYSGLETSSHHSASEGKSVSQKRLVCPNCHSEIEKQVEIEVPSSSETESTHHNLVMRGNKWFLVLESVIVCPHCKMPFGFDLWLPVLTEEEPITRVGGE